MNTKLDKTKIFSKKTFNETEFQTMMVHLNQTVIWLQMVNSFKPKGKLKERLVKTINNLNALSNMFPISETLFDKAIEISDSLFQITSLSLENQEILINSIKKQINELQQ